MKSLKFDHDAAQAIVRGERALTVRVRDDKNLSVNDVVTVVDKVEADRPETWRVIGIAYINRVLEKRLTDVVTDDMEGHEAYDSPEDMALVLQKSYKADVNTTSVVKFIYFPFLSVNSNIGVTSTTENVHKIELFADGGSRGNPGPSACGYVIIDALSGRLLTDKGVYIGITTNNQAEYLALKYGLEEALAMGAQMVHAHMDSLMVVNQLKGVFKVRNRDLWPVHEAVKALIARLPTFTIVHVPREQNSLADAAVNRTLDSHV